MKRILFSLLGFFFALNVAQAQAPRIFAGSSVGINVSQFNTNLYKTKFRPGLNFGTTFQATMKSGLGGRLEMRYSQLGSIQYTDIYARKYYRTSYLCFQPMLTFDFMKWKPDSRFYVMAGPDIQVYVSHHQEVPDNLYTENYKPTVFAATGGFTYLHQVADPLWLSFGVRYTHGLGDIVNLGRIPEVEGQEAPNMRHQAATFLFGLMMPIK